MTQGLQPTSSKVTKSSLEFQRTFPQNWFSTGEALRSMCLPCAFSILPNTVTLLYPWRLFLRATSIDSITEEISRNRCSYRTLMDTESMKERNAVNGTPQPSVLVPHRPFFQRAYFLLGALMVPKYSGSQSRSHTQTTCGASNILMTPKSSTGIR